MTQKEKLEALLENIDNEYGDYTAEFAEDTYKSPRLTANEFYAKRLLENGVIIPPVKIGQKVYDISDGTPYETRVLNLLWFGNSWGIRTISSFPNINEIGTRIFLTEEEAKKHLKI